MPLFGKKKDREPGGTAQEGDTYRHTSPSDAMSQVTPIRKAVPAAGLFGLGGRIIDKLFGVLQDPNGKISSKRAGAGALVVTAITFLTEQRIQEGIICLSAAIVLFALTKWDTSNPEE